MQPEQKQKEDPRKQQDFLLEQQLNIYSSQLPEISRQESNFFFKEIVREQTQSIAYVQIGFRIATISPDIYDIVSIVINDIHCLSEDNFKLIIDGQDLWVTSTLVYPFTMLGDLNYNITEANYKDSLMRARQIMENIIKCCKQGYQKMSGDEEILKQVRQIAKNFKKAFKDPNSDY